MQPDGDAKYLTEPRPITPELARRHIAGETLLGTTLWSTGGKTRMLRWEADDAEAFERLRRCASKLSESGARPLIETSPSKHHPGGGHLYLTFTDMIDAAGGHATAEHWAPELCQAKEHWPNGGTRVRLPAGRYRRRDEHGDVDAWCEVWQPGGLHVMGEAAFNLLLTRQTPASWVTIKPPPPKAPRRALSPPADSPWLPPKRRLLKGERDRELTSYAAAMRCKCGMAEDEIFDELCRIRDELCEYVPDDPITDGSLRAKARSAARKFGCDG